MGNSKNTERVTTFPSHSKSLPEETKYWPPIVIKHLDCSSKKEVAIGAAMFSNSEKFLEKQTHRSDVKPVVESNNANDNATELDPLLVKRPMNKLSKFLHFRRKKDDDRRTSISQASKQQAVESKFTWWTKFYNSLNHEQSKGGIEKHRLRIFDCELENCVEFSNLTDWAEPMKLLKGTNSKKLSGPKFLTYGMLKCNIRVIKTGEGDNSAAVVDMGGNR